MVSYFCAEVAERWRKICPFACLPLAVLVAVEGTWQSFSAIGRVAILVIVWVLQSIIFSSVEAF
jgi:hypothetical protein